jgi:hypothetical protein
MLFNKKKKLNAAPPAPEKVEDTQLGALNMATSGMSLADTQIDTEAPSVPGALASPLSPAGSVAAAPTPYFNIDFGFSKFEQEASSVTPSLATASLHHPTTTPVLSPGIDSGVSGVMPDPLPNTLPSTLPMGPAENHQPASPSSAPPKTLSTFQSLAQALESPRGSETNTTAPEIQLSSPDRLVSPDELYNPYQTMSPTQERSVSMEATDSMASPYSHQNNIGNTASDDYFFEPSAISPHEDESFHQLYAPGFDSPLHAQADPLAPVYQQNSMANPVESHLNQTTAHPGLNSFQAPFESSPALDIHQPMNQMNQVSQQSPSHQFSQSYGQSQGVHPKGKGPAKGTPVNYIDSTPIIAPPNSGIPSSYASPPVSYGGGIVDDFWTHTSPGFEDLSELHQGSLIENIHQQLYPQEDSFYSPPSSLSPELLQYQDFSETPQGERPIYTPENTLSDPSILDTNLDLDDFFAQVEDTTYLGSPPVGSVESKTVHPPVHQAQYQEVSYPQAISPQTNELHQPDVYYPESSLEPPIASPLPDHSEILANIQAEDIEVLGVCPLEQEKSLMFVQVKEHFALMALVSQQFSTLKLFPQDPRGADGSSLITAIPEKGMGNQVVYHAKIGTWQGVLNVSGSQMTLMSEL